MNLFNLTRIYIDSIPDGDTNLPNYTYIPLVIFAPKAPENMGVYYRGYNGLMASPDKYNSIYEKNKLGYFDFIIDTGNLFNRPVTHRMLFSRLLQYSALDKIYRVWQGEDIDEVAESFEEKRILYAMGLCMLEQEINWGYNLWQKWTNFPNRPRDMLMGFIIHAFERGIDDIPYWRNETCTFGGSFRKYDVRYRAYFEELNEYNTPGLLSGEILESFRNKIRLKNYHPKYMMLEYK